MSGPPGGKLIVRLDELPALEAKPVVRRKAVRARARQWPTTAKEGRALHRYALRGEAKHCDHERLMMPATAHESDVGVKVHDQSANLVPSQDNPRFRCAEIPAHSCEFVLQVGESARCERHVPRTHVRCEKDLLSEHQESRSFVPSPARAIPSAVPVSPRSDDQRRTSATASRDPMRAGSPAESRSGALRARRAARIWRLLTAAPARQS